MVSVERLARVKFLFTQTKVQLTAKFVQQSSSVNVTCALLSMHISCVCHVTRSRQSLIDIYLHDESFIITVKCTYILVRERR